MAGVLYLVGTPIGNLEDFSPRAQRILREVDFIAAEDTRVSVKLLNRFGIKKPLVSYHEHNLRERGELIVRRLLAGENGAVVTDAGMPCISDPGEDLVRLCVENGITVQVAPGPSALIAALCVSGLSTSRFSFEGFLSTAKKNRAAHLDSVKGNPNTLIFYEGPHKLARTLADLLACFGDRRIAVVKEMTKIHESVMRTTLSQALAYYTENPPKGEYVLVVEGAPPKTEPREKTLDDAVALAAALTEGGMKKSEAAKEAAAQTGKAKAEIYKKLVSSGF